MLTDDKVTKVDDVYDNVNTRDQNRTGILLVVLLVLFVGGLIGLGLSHSPETPATTQGQEMGPEGQPLASGQEASNFSVNKPIGAVELPGTIGQPGASDPAHFLTGKGNTPVPSQGQSGGVSNTTAIDAQSQGHAQSGSTASDAMPTGKNYDKNSVAPSGTSGGATTSTSTSTSTAAPSTPAPAGGH